MSREVSRNDECITYSIPLDCLCGCETGEIVGTVKIWPAPDEDSSDFAECTCLTYGLSHHLTEDMAQELRVGACLEALVEWRDSEKMRAEWAADQPQTRRLSEYFVPPSTRFLGN